MAGKYLYAGDRKLLIRGVTYGTFMPSSHGDDGYDPTMVEDDFAAMVRAGVNAVRLYTVPPPWLLESAMQHGLWVMADAPWEQHVAFLDTSAITRSIIERTSDAAASLAGHPAMLALALGNEIPSAIVRWHGARRVERFLDDLCRAVRQANPDILVTYANYPSTEYLRVPGADLVSVNLYLEQPDAFEGYVDRLMNLSAGRPVILSELGLDSRRSGLDAQADLILTEVEAAFFRGVAGTFVFAWTDAWTRAGTEVMDWDFGMTTRDRVPKPALSALRAAYQAVPLPERTDWPRISVVVCSYNGERTLGQCLAGLGSLDYPDFEVIVVDDGSTDRTAEIAAGFPVRLVRTANQGLSAARNEGLSLASGEFIAYIDDDAWPDPDWLRYLAWRFRSSDHVAVGGPNIAPGGDPGIADLVALAPGGPSHVLIDDNVAAHIPGCNMAFRTETLRVIGGFDPAFRVAGDDVDVGWRLQAGGMTIGFSHGAAVWHHRRHTVRAYWKQQRGYGRAEGLLARKCPSRYNRLGHVAWPGQLYGHGGGGQTAGRGRPHQGTWGTEMFQSLYESDSSLAGAPLMPEWFWLLALMLAVGTLGFAWTPMFLAWLVLVIASATSVLAAARVSGRAIKHGPRSAGRGRRGVLILWSLVLIQPIARLVGRVDQGLTPWRRYGAGRLSRPWPARDARWSGDWQSPTARLRDIEAKLHQSGIPVDRGGGFDQWDLEARIGPLASARLLLAAEEHGEGRQLIRSRIWPRLWGGAIVLAAAAMSTSIAAYLAGAEEVGAVFLVTFLAITAAAIRDAAAAQGALLKAIGR